MAAIRIFLNGETREIPPQIKLEELLELFSLPKQRIAIELNNDVVRRSNWQDVSIHDGDKIEVVHFVGGG
jgi:sulfur carrier protein